MPTPTAATSAPAQMGFADIVPQLLAGKKMRRASWPEAECVFLHADFLHLRKADGSMHRLMVSAGDLEGADWVALREQ